MPAVVYILERLNWRGSPVGWLRLPGADRLGTFADRAEAELALRDREWSLRRRINPFRCGGPFLHYQSGFDAARLHDWFLDAGLDPPGVTTDSAAWAARWDGDHAAMTDAQRSAAWEALDRVRFFRLDESPEPRPMHLVAEPHWEFDPISFAYGSYGRVGSSPYMLVRRTQTADAQCEALFAERVARSGGYIRGWGPDGSWEVDAPDPFDPNPPETPWREASEFAEHSPLALFSEQEPNPGQTMYVVLRRHWRLEVPNEGPWRWCLTSARPCGQAVGAFDSLAAADARIARLEAEARDGPSPFRFGTPLEWGTLPAGRVWGVLSGLAPIDFANLWNDYKAPDAVWSHWWDDAVSTLTPDQNALAWSLFENLRYYEVVAVEYRD